MSTELIAGIAVGHAIYTMTMLIVALVASWIGRFAANRVKTRLRKVDRTSLAAQMVDDVEEPAFLLVILAGVYLALIGLPPVADHELVVRRGVSVLAVVLVVYSIMRVQAHTVTWYISTVGRRSAQAKVLNTMLPMVKRTIGIFVLLMGALIIMDQLGIAIAPLVAGLGIAGLAVALALQGTLTNFFAGINILTDGSIRVGDYIELEGGLAGYIDQIGWRTTRIRMPANNMIIIPNSKLADSITTNYNFPEEQMSVYVTVGVAYSSDLDLVERVTVDVAKQVMGETTGSVEGYEPSIWYTDFADSNINFWVVLRSHGYMDTWLLKHNFIKTLLRRYNEEGIEISFPARSVYFKSEMPRLEGQGVTGRRGESRPPAASTAKGVALHQDMASAEGEGDGGEGGP